MKRLMAIPLVLVALLGTGPSFAQTRSSPDEATRALAVQALIDAIDRGDVPAVGESIELPLKLESEQLSLFAQRYVLGSTFFWILEEKFGERDAQRAMRVGRLDYFPKIDPNQLRWEAREVRRPLDAEHVKERFMGSIPQSGRVVVLMVNTENAWKADLTGEIPAMVVLNVEDARWRNRIVQQVTDEVKAGKLTSIKQVIHALVLHAPEQHEPVKANRSTPEGAIVAAADALERDDAATLGDSFDVMGGDDDGFIRGMVEEAVLKCKVASTVRVKYPPDQAERIIREGSLKRGILVSYQNIPGWVVDGDVARAAFKEGFYDVTRRMVRRNGVWRIQFPPRHTLRTPDDARLELEEQARKAALQEVLDHPERFASAGALLEALNPSMKEMAAEQVDAGASARRQLEEIKQEMAKNPPRTPQEAAEHALGLSLWELGVAVASKDAKEAAKHYFAEGDDGSYAVARENRLLAAHELLLAADKEIDSGAGTLLHEFDLSNPADDIYGLFMLQLKIHGDRAVPTVGDQDGDWVPGIRKIAGEWKLDVSDETGGNPNVAAKRADDETRKLEELTAQVKAGKFTNLDQLRKAMKDAEIKGSPVRRS